MRTAQQWDAAMENRPDTRVEVLGKLLAAAVILVPLAMLLFPELHQCSGTASQRRQDIPAAQRAPARALFPDRLTPNLFSRSEP